MPKKAPVALEAITTQHEIAWEEACVATFRDLPYVQISGDFFTLPEVRSLLAVVDHAQRYSRTTTVPREKVWQVNGFVVESGTIDNPALHINDQELPPRYIETTVKILTEACQYVRSWSATGEIHAVS